MSKLSPSKADYIALCPCYDAGEFKQSAAAERGTALHLAVETGDLSNIEAEDIPLVEKCVEEQKAVIRTAQKVAADQGVPEVIELKEVKLPFFDGANGIIDWLVIAGDTAYITDWKFGEEPPVDASQNLQLAAYAYMVLNQYKDVHEVNVALFLPALDMASKHSYKRIDLDALELIFTSLKANADNPNKEPKPSARACQWCANKADCKALMAIATRVSELPVPTELNPAQIREPKDLTRAMVLVGVLSDWCDQVKQHCTKLALEDGIATPGFEIKSRAGAKKVIDNIKAKELILGLCEDLSSDDVLTAGSLSIPKLTDVLSAKGGLTKKAAKEQILQALDEVIVEKDRSTWLQKEKGRTYEEVLQLGS